MVVAPFNIINLYHSYIEMSFFHLCMFYRLGALKSVTRALKMLVLKNWSLAFKTELKTFVITQISFSVSRNAVERHGRNQVLVLCPSPPHSAAIGLAHAISAVIARASSAFPSVWSFPSVFGLLSHSNNVIPFPVFHQEFQPFFVCPPPGREQANNMSHDVTREVPLAVFTWWWEQC